MKTVFSTISLLTAVALVVPGAAGLCGPNSNCQIVEQDGIRKYKLRPGAQPVEVKELPAGGSASGSTAGLQVNVIMGQTSLQYGCGSDVWAMIRDALDSSCSPNNHACDEGLKKEFEIKKWAGHKKAPTKAKISITTEGHWRTPEIRHQLAQALLATIHQTTVSSENSKWEEKRSAKSESLGMISTQGWCDIKKFPKFVQVMRFVGESDGGSLEIKTEAEKAEEKCIPTEILEQVGTLIHEKVGLIFGIANVMCNLLNPADKDE